MRNNSYSYRKIKKLEERIKFLEIENRNLSKENAFLSEEKTRLKRLNNEKEEQISKITEEFNNASNKYFNNLKDVKNLKSIYGKAIIIQKKKNKEYEHQISELIKQLSKGGHKK